MGINRNTCLAAAVTFAAAVAAQAGRAEESEVDRAARWHDVASAIFHGREIKDGSSVLQLDTPPRALDAALVPVTVAVAANASPKALYLIIDDNPAPVAAIAHFGPLADPHVLKLRVRIDQYTLVHAVAEMSDGRLFAVSKYVKAAGGCSAPGTTNQVAAMARLGKMKLIQAAPPPDGQPQIAELLISHPNYNGMQMDPVSRIYTPARYVQTVTITEAGKLVLTLDGDISLSQDPAITFGYHAVPAKALDVEVLDSAHAVFRQSFPLQARAS